MANVTKYKKQTAVRIFPDDFEKLKARLVVDSITLQKLFDILVKSYLSGNEEIQKLVDKYKDSRASKKRRYTLTEMEANDILSHIEQFNPLNENKKNIKEALKELEDENE